MMAIQRLDVIGMKQYAQIQPTSHKQIAKTDVTKVTLLRHISL